MSEQLEEQYKLCWGPGRILVFHVDELVLNLAELCATTHLHLNGPMKAALINILSTMDRMTELNEEFINSSANFI